MNKKKIGIIGTGKHFSERIYPVLSKSSFFKISGVLRRKKKFFKNIPNFNKRDFFKKKFDFIYISCPNKFHETYIINSLRSGSHVICEKPFVIRKKNLSKIIKLAKNKRKLIFEAFMYVYHPVFKFVEKIIREKKFGKLCYVVSNFRYPSLKKNNNRYKVKEGDGFFYDAASYLISLENYLFNNEKKMSTKFYSQKIKNKVDLRGNIFIRSVKGTRIYFWGEGQNYSNNLEIFLERATIYIDKFFSKAKDEIIKVKFYSKNLKEKILKPADQFERMFYVIQKNYNNKSFQKMHIDKIKKQLDLLTKYNI